MLSRLAPINDYNTRENLNVLRDLIENSPFFKLNVKFFEIEFDAAISNFKQPHNLEFVPKDVILLYTSGAGNVTFNYDLFDEQDLDITTSGAVTVRFLAGRYEE